MSLLNEKIVNNSAKAVNNICFVKSAGIVSPDPSWMAIREDSHDVLAFYISDGKAKLTAAGGEYPLYRGDCVIFPSRKYSKIQSDAKNPPSVHWLRFGGELAEAMIRCYFPNMRAIISTCDVRDCFSRAFELLSQNSDADDELTLLILKLVISVKNSLSTTQTGRIKPGASSNKFEDYIVSHMYDKLDVHDFAEHFGMSVPALTGVLKRKFGKTPYQYYLSVKIEMAKNMLSSSDSSADDIAERLCFTDRTHFSKLFKRETGMTPAEYRNAGAGKRRSKAEKPQEV